MGSVLDEDLNVAMKAFAKTPKRNEPCPCQSGKKYKDCCAKSGPRRAGSPSSSK
ncbi:SEC-C metal-binding domain-containing protein [Citrobacter youngae]|uniref:SEC-C metal-binding domain-containing protein n=1 Tax=Citrobacter youngae TaxID=133448 RepID=UPI0019536C99